jgi:hypothetical protein
MQHEIGSGVTTRCNGFSSESSALLWCCPFSFYEKSYFIIAQTLRNRKTIFHFQIVSRAVHIILEHDFNRFKFKYIALEIM